MTSRQFVDLAEGVRRVEDEPHLPACEACRSTLAALRETLAIAADVDVPEPSPLFWDHLSARVARAVAAEDVAAFRWTRLAAARVLAPAVAVALVLAVGVVAGVRVWRAPGAMPDPAVAIADPTAVEIEADAGFPVMSDDPSLDLVAALSEQLDWNEAAEAGLARPGAADHAVSHLSREERLELQRLLREELGRSAS